MLKTHRPDPAPRLDLAHRPRRNRKADWARRLVSEHVLTTNDLIWPLFLVEGAKQRIPVAAMPGVERLTVDEAVRDAERAAKLGIPAIAFFPYTEPSLKDEHGSEAFNESNLVCKACRAIKKEFPEIGLVTDVALDPYTSHGHDGLMEDERILNDESVVALIKQSLNQARAGADVIAPSDMMDGRVGAIRDALDAEGFLDVQILAYAAKYASAFYGPFRDAVGSSGALKGDKRTYQMDPANSNEALREVELDLAERGRRHGDGETRPALSRHHPPREGRIRRADLRLSGQRRIFDDPRRGSERLARSRQGDDGKPDRVQARRRGRRADLFCAEGGREAQGAALTSDGNPHADALLFAWRLLVRLAHRPL
jgi:porphobilinogen synthase